MSKFAARRTATAGRRATPHPDAGPDLRVFLPCPEDWCRSAYPPPLAQEVLHASAIDQVAAQPGLRLLGGPTWQRVGGDGIEQGFPAAYGYAATYRTAHRKGKQS